MSHSTVLVCLPADTTPETLDAAVSAAMEPFDENAGVEPYRDYEEGEPGDYWWVGSVRRGAEHHRNGTGIRPHSADVFASNRTSRYTEDEQRAEYEDDARWADRLGEKPGWADVVSAYNAKYHGTESPATGDEDADDGSWLYYEAETDRAYTMSTYNPKSRWDWYQVGGRWRWTMLARQGVDRSALVLTRLKDDGRPLGDVFEIMERQRAGLPITAEYGPNGGLWCDGGPRGLLDFDAMRTEAVVKANAEVDAWEAFWAALPQSARETAKPWSYYVEILKAEGYDQRDLLGEQYRNQPWKIAASEAFPDRWLSPDLLDEFRVGREAYVADARRSAVPGYALLTLDGEWNEKGRMGWWGMSSATDDSTDAYLDAANTYLDELDPEAWVVLVDVHI